MVANSSTRISCLNMYTRFANQSDTVVIYINIYREVSNISRTKSEHLKDSRSVLLLSLPNPLKPDVKSRMKAMLQAMLQLHLSDRQFYCLLRCVLYKRLYGICICFLFLWSIGLEIRCHIVRSKKPVYNTNKRLQVNFSWNATIN